MQRSSNITWRNPLEAIGWNAHPSDQKTEADLYIPLNDFVPFCTPVEGNKRFGDYFLSLIHGKSIPMCEVAAWTHMTGARICQVFEGTAPAPNLEQLTVARLLLSLNEKEFDKLTELAISSWIASGLEPYEQIQPTQTIFNKRQAQEKPKAPATKAKKAIKRTETSQNEKPKDKKQYQEKVKYTAPNLRIKVKVESVEIDNMTLIQNVYAGIGDKIHIDEVCAVERNMDDIVHYGCRSGKHRIDLFREHGNWYMDSSKLVSGL